MKIVIKKILRAIGSRMTYLLIGLSFSVVVIAVNAAVTITSTDAISGSTLTKAKWDAMVNDLENIRDEVNGQAIECMTKTAPMNVCSGGVCAGGVDCDAGWLMTGGGCTVSNYDGWRHFASSYPIANGWRCRQEADRYQGAVYLRCCR